VAVAEESKADRAKYGRLIGDFTNLKYGVKGTVYAVDLTKLFIRGFSLDNKAVETSFYVKIKGHDDLHKTIFRPSQR
jgi:hypothetical protein